MIDWKQNVPKWQQVADVLKERIEAGVYPVDTPLPSEHQLVQEFGPEFSRPTARKVLIRLREQGWAYAVRGLGTFVADRQAEGDGGGEG